MAKHTLFMITSADECASESAALITDSRKAVEEFQAWAAIERRILTQLKLSTLIAIDETHALLRRYPVNPPVFAPDQTATKEIRV